MTVIVASILGPGRAVQLHNHSTGPRPLIICQGVPEDLDESPGPALVLRDGGRRSESALRWAMCFGSACGRVERS